MDEVFITPTEPFSGRPGGATFDCTKLPDTNALSYWARGVISRNFLLVDPEERPEVLKALASEVRVAILNYLASKGR